MTNNIVLHGLDDRLDEILKDTYYQLIYQEQVTAIAVSLAGWSEGEADSIRKTIGRKIQKELDALIPRLTNDFIKNGMKEESAKTLASAIQACGSYSFNKCLAGSEAIMLLNNCAPLTLEQIYKICHNKDYANKTGSSGLRVKYRNHDYGTGYSMDEENTVIDNKIFNIEFGGIREVFKVTLSNGETVRCTSNHKFPTNKGVLQLSEIQVGDSLYVMKKENYRIGRRSIGYARRYFEECKITSIVPDGVDNTYSVEMIDAPHNFVLANGIVSCNSHSYEYGLIAYQTAYLKANYPVEYMCSLLNANIDVTDDVLKYLEECKNMDITILPPDIKIGNLRFIPENGNSIRIGLAYIKGISNIEVKQADNIVDFFRINGYNKRVKEALIKAGALDGFGCSRQELFKLAFDIEHEIELEQNKIKACQEKIEFKEAEIEKSKQGTKKVGTLKNQIENQKQNIIKINAKIAELQSAYSNNYNEEQGEIEVLGFTFKDKYDKYNTNIYQTYNSNLIITQRFLADIVNIRILQDKRNRTMAFIDAIPRNGIKTSFVLFSSNFKEEYRNLSGIYALTLKNKNQIVCIDKPVLKNK